MNHTSLLLAAIGIFVVGLLRAQSDSLSRVDWLQIDGLLQQDHYSYFDSIPNADVGQSQDETTLELNAKIGPFGNLHFETSVRANLNFQRASRTNLLLNEAFGQWRKDGWILRFGKQIIDWGDLTGYSQADRLNRMAYFDFLDMEGEELGVWAFQGKRAFGKSNIGLTVIPGFQSSRFFVGESRWLTLPVLIPFSLEPSRAVRADFRVREGLTPKTPVQVGLNWEKAAGKVDLRVGYYYGVNAIPQTQIDTLGFNPIRGLQFQVNLRHRRLQMLTAGFDTYLGEFNLWGELSAIKTQRWNTELVWTDDPYYLFSIGTDRLWLMPNRPQSSFHQLFQFIYLFNFHGNEYRNLDLDLIFQRSVLSKSEFQLSYDWKFTFTNAWEIKNGGYYTQLMAAFTPAPSLKLAVIGDLLFGAEDSFFGHYGFNRRIQLRAEILFEALAE